MKTMTKLTIMDKVKTPEGLHGRIAEFDRGNDGGLLAKVWITKKLGAPEPRWYITSELKPV